jgi:hypothetical protein
MRQAHARKPFDAYLDAPKRSERPHLHVVRDLREEAPAVRIPDADPAIERPAWAIPFEDGRWDAALGEPPLQDKDGRRTVVVTGRPGPQHQPRRDHSAGPTARQRGHSPTRARLAGRPDRVALWAVALALVMAAMAGFSGNGPGTASPDAGAATPAPLQSR